jgi:MFS superfamily sulfate permease-like transporter
LIPPKTPDLALIKRVFAPSVAVFLAASLEHIAIAKSFGRKNHYTISANQELTFLGVANLANSFFGGMAVGGAASRTAVNSESGVKSPLSGIVTSRNFKEVYPQLEGGYGRQHAQMGTQIVRFDYPIIFVNASRAKESILDAVQTWNLGAPPFSDSASGNPDRLWNELGAKRIKFLRQKAGIQPRDEEYLPQIRAVVLDFQGVRYVDATGIEALKAMKTELRTYAGDGVGIRFVGLRKLLVGKLERAGWSFIDQ